MPLSHCDYFESYIAEHMDVQQRMLHAIYPNIHSESTSIKFCYQGHAWCRLIQSASMGMDVLPAGHHPFAQVWRRDPANV